MKPSNLKKLLSNEQKRKKVSKTDCTKAKRRLERLLTVKCVKGTKIYSHKIWGNTEKSFVFLIPKNLHFPNGYMKIGSSVSNTEFKIKCFDEIAKRIEKGDLEGGSEKYPIKLKGPHMLKKYFGEPCKIKGCKDTKIVAHGLCMKHYGWYRRKAIDSDGNPIREIKEHFNNKHKTCKIDGCENHASTRHLCTLHYSRFKQGIIDEDGNELRKLNRVENKLDECKVSDCHHVPTVANFCPTHYRYYRHGMIDYDGNLSTDEIPKERRCKVDSCTKGSMSKGFCHRHYLQLRNGILDEAGQQLRNLKHRAYNTIHKRIPGKIIEGKRVCKIPSCERDHYARGFCNKHYIKSRNQ